MPLAVSWQQQGRLDSTARAIEHAPGEMTTEAAEPALDPAKLFGIDDDAAGLHPRASERHDRRPTQRDELTRPTASCPPPRAAP